MVAAMDIICRVGKVGDVPILSVSGELDLASVPVLHDALSKLLTDAHGQTVVVDLDGVSLLDDVALGVLLGAAGRAREAGGDLAVVCTDGRLLQRFAVTGLNRAIDIRSRVTP
jgi:anti-sigma B factor antagonist